MKHQSFPHCSVLRCAIRVIRKIRASAGIAGPWAALGLAVVTLVPAVRAQDVTFGKTRYSSAKHPKEADVVLTVADSKVLIKGKKEDGINMEIPFSSIDSMSYEVAARHRVAEGAMLGSLLLMTTKTKSHWLDIEYREGNAKQLTTLRLDKSEYQQAIATLRAKTGKNIATLNSNTSAFNPTAGSKDMDELVPFRMDTVVAAVKPAMESVGCNACDCQPHRVQARMGKHSRHRTDGLGR